MYNIDAMSKMDMREWRRCIRTILCWNNYSKQGKFY